MNKLLKETGVLTEHGQAVVKNFAASLDHLLSLFEILALNTSETRNLQAVLINMVGHKMSQQVLAVSKLEHLTAVNMSEYLVNKYGHNWGFNSLTKEEYAVWFKLHPFDNSLKE